MKSLSNTLFAFRQAHRILWSGGLWRYLSLPILLSVVYLPLLVFGCLQVSDWLSDWVSGRLGIAESSTFVQGLVKLLFLGLFGFVGVVTYRSVVLVFYSPFLDRISERVEARFLQRESSPRRGLAETILRVLTVAFLTILVTAVLMVADCLSPVVPVIGWALPFVVVLPLQIFVAGTGYIDPYLDRQGYSPGGSFRLMWRHFRAVTFFSLVSNVFLLIPFFGWFVGPTYSVIAGAILGIAIDEKNDLGITDLRGRARF